MASTVSSIRRSILGKTLGLAATTFQRSLLSTVVTRLLDGKQCALEWQEEMAKEVKHIVATAGRPPGLGVVLVGDRPDSHVYVLRKREACESIGVMSKIKYLEDTCSQTSIRQAVQSMCKDTTIDGVLVQVCRCC